MRAIYIGIIIMIMLVSACKNRSGYQQVKDKDITFQINLLDDPKDDTNLNYKVRISPEKSISEKISGKDKIGLMYRMDSCFYIKTKESKIYASLTQPIANGVAGTYEYLLEFEMTKTQQQSAVAFVYQDRYINRKVYHISFDQHKP